MGKRTNAIIKLGADVKDAKTGIDVIIQELNKLKNTSFAQKASQLGSAVSGVAAAFSLLYHLPISEGRLVTLLFYRVTISFASTTFTVMQVLIWQVSYIFITTASQRIQKCRTF